MIEKSKQIYFSVRLFLCIKLGHIMCILSVIILQTYNNVYYDFKLISVKKNEKRILQSFTKATGQFSQNHIA